jgi:hypothetical protein
MDSSVHRALNDKLYDKRKLGALEYVYIDLVRRTYPVTMRLSSTHHSSP